MKKHRTKSSKSGDVTESRSVHSARKSNGVESKKLISVITEAVRFSLAVSLSVLVIVAAGDLFVGIEKDYSSSIIYASSFASKLFLGLFLGKLLFFISSKWYSNFIKGKESKKTLFTAVLSAVAVTFCLYTSFYYFKSTSLSSIVHDECHTRKNAECRKNMTEIHQHENTAISPTPLDSYAGANKSEVDIPNAREHMSLARFKEMTTELRIDDFDINQRIDIIEDTFAGIFSDEKIEDWDIYISELDATSIDQPSYVRVLISRAILSEAPFDILLEILNRGHELNGNHISMLASRLTLEELKVLENYGVDVTASSLAGSNVLISSLFNPNREEIFEYFLSNDQVVYANDIDVIKGILETSRLLNFNISYAQKALERGAEVSAETKIWIENDLKAKDLDFYTKIKEGLKI